ncbi:hypothetical protein ACLB2K_046552 [Fragaria x ananassa]
MYAHIPSSLNYFPHFASARSITEAEALLKQKTSFLNQTSHNNQLKDWIYLPMSTDNNATNSSSNPRANGSPCNWTGISCNAAGSVTNISIASSGIQGMLHEFSFSSFPDLEYLDLSGNELFYVIPPQISSLSKLQHLDLSNNQFSGRIPPEIDFINITELNLGQNNLSGTIPKELGNLKSLVDLDLSTNQLYGSLPTTLGDLTNLTTLSLYNNNLFGTLLH